MLAPSGNISATTPVSIACGWKIAPSNMTFPEFVHGLERKDIIIDLGEDSYYININ
jgi:hypothetical protein